MRIVSAIGWFLAGAIAIFSLTITAHKAGYLIVFPEGKQQVELASLFLAAASLIITMVAVILAIAAVVGYNALKEAASAAGKVSGENAARELLAGMVRQEVAERLAASEGPDRTEELTAALAARGNDAGPTQN